MTSSRILAPAAALLCIALAGAVIAQPAPPGPAGNGQPKRPAISLELNKLEPAAGGCRAYFVVENRTPDAVRELRLDTFIFDANGLIARRIGLTFPDLRPGADEVVPFDLSGAACPEIGRLLVNDVLACTGSAGPVQGCGDLISVSTRSATRFEY